MREAKDYTKRMRGIVKALFRVSAIAAVVLAGGACVDMRPLQPVPQYGGDWPGWRNNDEGGFEQGGKVGWEDGGALYYGGAKGTSPGYRAAPAQVGGNEVYPLGVVNYQFYPTRKGLWRLWAPMRYVRLSAHGSVDNRIVLDRAAASGSVVHISGRLRSGLRPDEAYVEVQRATPVKRLERIAW